MKRQHPKSLKRVRWLSLRDPEEVAQRACAHVLRCAARAVNERGRFSLVLAGGSTPASTYQRLARAAADWHHWQIYFSDERCLPPDNAERNSRMAQQTWLDRVTIPAENIHIIAAENEPEQGARAYASQVAAALPFDLVLLGLGNDGHTASLFPDQKHPASELVHAVRNAPKPPPERITLSIAALSRSREVLFLVTGRDKRDAVAAWQAGACLPAARIGPDAVVTVLLDADADPSRPF